MEDGAVGHNFTFHILIFSSETIGKIPTKLWWNGSLMAPFKICVRWSRLPTEMAAKLKIEKRGDEILIVHCCFSISQNELSSHLEWRTGLSDTILKGTHTGTTPARFGLIWSSGLRGEDLNVIPVFLWDPCCLSCCFVLSLIPFKIVSDSPVLHSRWLLLLKIENSSIVHCCFSIRQNGLTF
jgi:hypothetical protein